MSFGAGLAAGIGIGIAVGVSSGTKQARDKLGQYIESQGITLQDQQGKQVAIDDVLDLALRCGDSKRQKVVIVTLVLGLLVAALVGVAFYFLVTHG